MKGWLSGLAPKLVAMMAVATVLVAGVMTWRAAAVLDEQLAQAFASKGEAIALSLASAAEHDADNNPIIQAAVDSNKVIYGVAYIFLEDPDGEVEVHTFSPAFPTQLRGRNRVEPGELSSQQRVKVARLELQLDQGDGGKRELEAMDIAAPISGGALGTVHVGMDRGIIGAQVERLRWSMLWLGTAAAVLGIGFALGLIIALVVRPVRELTRVTSDIVSKGDLTQTIRVKSNDEIGQLALTFTRMVEKLRQIPTGLQEAISILAGAALNLNQSTGEHNQTLTRQAAA
ncbi:MAG TPA: HAMP domain-containing protein, partial [Myxococcales bacterium]|nr:HAMP domain-containing protein [Myxococcales bacterium]